MNADVKRRQEDLNKLKKMAEDYPEIITVTGYSGNPLNKILLDLKIPTSKNPNFPFETQQSSRIQIDLSSHYPFVAPVLYITTPVWHPNVYANGLICHGSKWVPTEGLDLLVYWIMKLLSYDKSVVNPNSAANGEAAQWYKSKLNRGIFPTINLNAYKSEKKVSISWKNFEPEQKVIIICPHCRQSLRVLKGHKLKVTCTSCKYLFEVST